MLILEEGVIYINLKLSLVALGLAGITLLTPAATFAQTATTSSKPNEAARLATLHTNCDNQINQRLTDLNNALTRINGLVKLSADQKSQFAGEIQTDIAGLTALKTKCDADTDLTTLKADDKLIFTQYRVYVVFLPQMHLLAASDTMTVTSSQLSDLATKLQSRIQEVNNPANLTSLLTDMKSKITDSQTQYQTVESQILPLTPNSFNTDPNGTKTTEQTARSEIKTGVSDLHIAWSDAKQIVQILKSLKTQPTPTATPNAS